MTAQGPVKEQPPDGMSHRGSCDASTSRSLAKQRTGPISVGWGVHRRLKNEGEYQTRCARGACAVRVLGLFHRPFHPEPIRGNGNASEPSRYHLQLLSQ